MADIDPDELPDDPVERNRALNAKPRTTPGRADLGAERFPRYAAVTITAMAAATTVLIIALLWSPS